MIDLHTHTNQSDGSFTPTELVLEAERAGLDAVAITDHDTLAGLQEAEAAGALVGVRVIPGVELSAEWQTGSLHILGYFIDPADSRLLQALDAQRRRRKERLASILVKLARLGMPLSYDEALRTSAGGVPGKPHIAELMVAKGYAPDVGRARKEYLEKGGRAYTPKVKLSPEDAVELIVGAGGAAVLAHPHSAFRNDMTGFSSALARFKDIGLVGVEVYYPLHSADEALFYESNAKDLDLAITGGSDFHGTRKPEIHLGEVWNGRPLPSSYLADLERRRP
jgi:predicted metal-dependent phosphoesterase TrpH